MFIKCINLRGKRKVGAISGVLAVAVLLTSLFGGFKASGDEGIPANADEALKTTVIIDAGHGGEDGGAVGDNGVLEKDISLSIALMLGEQLKEKGIDVVYTRTEDKMLYLPDENVKGLRKLSDLKQRCLVAKENPDALFVSIHVNSFGQEKYSGTEVYYSEESDESLILAERIRAAVVREAQPDNRRTLKKGGEIYLLEHVDNPAVLIECGFISNPEECRKLSQKEYQKLLSFSIACGIIEYVKGNAD